MVSRFGCGEVVLLRWRRNHPADVVVPVRVVADLPDSIALYTAPGTICKGQATAEGRKLGRETPFLERERMIGGLADFVWADHHVLHLIRPGEARSTWLLWREADWAFRSYYVNLQAPVQRTAVGFDTADYLLDLEVTPDLAWVWKDREEAEEARVHGLISHEILDRMEAEAGRAIQDIEEKRWPYNAGFETWRPDPTWEGLALPDRWGHGLESPFRPVFGD